MEIVEIKNNIISVPQGWYIAHAISSDFNFNAGLPKIMDSVFNLKDSLDCLYSGTSFDVGTAIQTGNVFNLIVKESSYDAPDEQALLDALIDLRDLCDSMGIKKLAMPKICSGKNGLDWENVVLETIKFVFDDSDITILICS